jgi:hypothetical protein
MRRMAAHGGGRSVGAEAKFGPWRLAAALLRPGLRDVRVPDGVAGPGRAPLARKSGRGQPRGMKARASSRTPYEAKKKSTATLPKAEIRSSCSKQRRSHFSNRNKNAHPKRMGILRDQRESKDPSWIGVLRVQREPKDLSFARTGASSSSLQLRDSSLQNPSSNRQLETIRNRHNPFTINQMTFSNKIIYFTKVVKFPFPQRKAAKQE